MNGEIIIIEDLLGDSWENFVKVISYVYCNGKVVLGRDYQERYGKRIGE